MEELDPKLSQLVLAKFASETSTGAKKGARRVAHCTQENTLCEEERSIPDTPNASAKTSPLWYSCLTTLRRAL